METLQKIAQFISIRVKITHHSRCHVSKDLAIAQFEE
jgi:hypothetical protein